MILAAQPIEAPDCAAAYIEYVAHPTELSAQMARACMVQPVAEAFSPDLAASEATRVLRIGEATTTDGFTLVFYVVDQQEQTFWYVISLDPAGRFTAVE